ncbi:Crp/Fnr family transcriptional regulator [Propylenella binzhouense]|uniref:Crp/Fnr family transcriptional regulator n=1 Tax=Propylenella binzhouense TaxID=2555902 RepID=A0A964WTQ9_9HYPH|nr:Crp/Fnr family transcriptional regulator [Propylenella binzhouense]MYZ48095.1 Crp/Fnr family transcriptional regulator [Propylenella binzhouense]
MTSLSISAIRPFIRKLEAFRTISDEERSDLEALPMQITEIRADQDLVREGDRPSRCCVLLRGFGHTYKMTEDGKRQITAFHVPGDMPDLQSLELQYLDCSIGTCSPSVVGFIPHEALREICRLRPQLAAVFWRTTLVDASIFREWMLNIGRREAYNRVAHVFCELLVRLNAVGLARNHSCEMPFTQIEFADATGISTVHVNRMIQDLRSAGLIVLRGGMLTAPDWAGLKAAGGFDPGYLHMERALAA